MSDELLQFDKNTKVVSLTPYTESFASFKSLKAADKTKNKLTFNAQLKVLYFMFSINSPITDRYGPQERLNFIYRESIPYKRERIETPEFKVCWNMMIRHGMSREEAQFHQIQTDFDKFLDHLNSISWDRTITEVTKVGKKEKTSSYTVSNSEERMKAVKHSAEILKLQKDLEGIVMGQRRKKEQSNTKIRDWENPEYIDSIEIKKPIEKEPDL